MKNKKIKLPVLFWIRRKYLHAIGNHINFKYYDRDPRKYRQVDRRSLAKYAESRLG